MVQAHRPRSVKVFEVAPDKKSSIRPTVCAVESAGSVSPRSPPGSDASVFTKVHLVSRRSSHSRATGPLVRAVAPGQRALTASFAARGSRVQIPSAPLNALVWRCWSATGDCKVDLSPSPVAQVLHGIAVRRGTPFAITKGRPQWSDCSCHDGHLHQSKSVAWTS